MLDPFKKGNVVRLVPEDEPSGKLLTLLLNTVKFSTLSDRESIAKTQNHSVITANNSI